MSQQLPGSRAPRPFRSRAAVIAVIGWWAAAVLGIAGWLLVDAALTADNGRFRGQLGTWLIGFAALGSVVGWGASIGALLRDTGRVRAGVLCLIGVPLLAAVMGWIALSSTVFDPYDPLAALWFVGSGVLLLVATLLIMLPEHLGTH